MKKNCLTGEVFTIKFPQLLNSTSTLALHGIHNELTSYMYIVKPLKQKLNVAYYLSTKKLSTETVA